MRRIIQWVMGANVTIDVRSDGATLQFNIDGDQQQVNTGDVVVPYGNYLAFRDAHPQGEDSMYRIDDTFSKADHLDAGASFLMTLLAAKGYGAYFNWICEGNMPTGITTTSFTNSADVWHTLDGRKLSEGCLQGKMPTKKGVYIHNGIKVVIK